MTAPVIYILSDGKPGHLAQSRGLAEALASRTAATIHEIDANAKPRLPKGNESKRGLLLTAGRATIPIALSCSHRLGVSAIALMNPGWFKRRAFDLCIIPRHDGIAESGKVIVTEGALNGIQPATDASADDVLLLIGGPSKHHRWEDESLLAQLHTLLGRETQMKWIATSSRRTPDSTDKHLREVAEEHGDRFVYTSASETPRGWVAEQLQRCGTVWVTEDSVSMVYESLTAGARVGLLDVPRRSGKPGRVMRGVESLVERGWVTRYDDWREGRPLPSDRPPLQEADRVAKLVLERFPLAQ